jgi:P pilus assembly chaperone PapD
MRSTLALTACLASLLVAPRARAEGAALQLSTTRITVGPRERTAGITLSNQSGEQQRYRVSVIDMVMDTDGNVSEVKDEKAPDRGASKWVIATPATVHLAPGESQKIRLLIRRPGVLADGEYRAHLRVAQEPPADATGGLREGTASGDGLSLKLTTVYAMTIPVFVEQGQTHSTASIAEAHVVENGKRVALTLQREGNSAFRGFVQTTAEHASAVFMPCVVYAELDAMKLAYDLGPLANVTGPLTLNLYTGSPPDPGGEPSIKALSSIRILR